MKKIIFLAILMLTTGIMFSCSDSSNGKSETGYIDPGLDEPKTQALKSYSFTDSSLSSYSCSSAKTCGAIIYRGKLDGTNYTGFAVGKDTDNPDFYIKIYWFSNSLDSINTAAFNISALVSGTIYTTASGSLDVTITSELDSNSVTRYKIVFNSPITFGAGAYTINTTDTIYAYKYPEDD